MNTDKLVTIDDDSLSNVAGGGFGEKVQGLIEAGLNAGIQNAQATLGFIEDRTKIANELLKNIQKILLGK